MQTKICGVKDQKTLKYLISHDQPPNFIGFIANYKKSRRFVPYKDLNNLINVEKGLVKFVSVLVNPSDEFLDEIFYLNFDYYQLYDVDVDRVIEIKKKYKKKIITAITISGKLDVEKYKQFQNISDIILFDSKGYEESVRFDHDFLKDIPKNFTRMLGGNIQYDENFEKFLKITDIIDISGNLETNGEKDLNKIDIFLNNIKKLNESLLDSNL